VLLVEGDAGGVADAAGLDHAAKGELVPVQVDLHLNKRVLEGEARSVSSTSPQRSTSKKNNDLRTHTHPHTEQQVNRILTLAM
jgi:hypothetical protein